MAVATTQQANYIVAGKFKDGVTGPARKAFNNFQRAAKASFAVVSAATIALVLLIKKTLDSFDAIGKGADRIGITTDALQEYRFAFDKAGISQETVDKSLLNFTKRLGKARQGIGALEGGLKGGQEELLATVKATNSASEALEVIFKAMGDAKNQAQRLAIADAAFGGGGLKMTAAFNDGNVSFQKWIGTAREMGIVIDEDLIRKAEKLNDEMSLLSSVVKNNFQAGLIDGFVDDFGELHELIVDPDFRQGVKDLGQRLGSLFDSLIQGNAIPLVIGFFIQIGNVMAGVLGLVNLLQSAWFGLGAAIGAVTDTLRLSEGQFDKFSKKAVDAFDAYEASIEPLSNSFRELLGIEVERKTSAISEGMKTANDATMQLTASSDQLANSSVRVTDAVKTQADAHSKLAEKISAVGEIQRRLSAGNSALADGLIDFNRKLEEGKRITESLRTPLQVYQDELAKLNDLQKVGAITQEIHSRAIRAAEDAYKSASTAARSFQGAIPFSGAGSTGESDQPIGRFLGDIPRRSFSDLKSSGGKLLGSVPGFASGIERVPFDMLAMIHKDEKILNKKDAEESRQSNGGVTIGKVTFQISGENKNPRQLAREIRDELSRLNERAVA